MSFNLAASAALPPPVTDIAGVHAPQCQAQGEEAESHRNAVQAPEAAVARVDHCSAALRASASQHTLGRLSPQFCGAVFWLKSAASMCASMAAQLHLPRAQFDVLSALRCNDMCLYQVGFSREERWGAMGGGGVGLLVLRLTATGGAFGRDMKRMMISVVRHVAAVHAAATPEAFFERGQREYDDGLYASAAESWGRAVDLKHVHAHALLSAMLVEGRMDLPKDCERAFELASAGAGMGCAHSKGVLGRCYGGGYGVAEDCAKAIELGRESAAAGSCMGQYLVGACYRFGKGVAQDDAEAARFFKPAAAQGLAIALSNLGVMFDLGLGVAQDYAEAMRLYHLAAEQGHALAQYNLGTMFERGQGVAQDSAEAVRLYRLAAAQGNSSAQHNLGAAFANGRGVAQDRAEAIRWFRLAAAQGRTEAAAALRRLGE